MDVFIHRALEHPDITAVLETGYPRRGEPMRCPQCGGAMEPGDAAYGVWLEYGGKRLCRDCFTEAVEEDLHRDPVAFAYSLWMEVTPV